MPSSGAGDPYSIKVFARNEEIDIKRTASYKRNKARLLGTIPAYAGNIRANRYILVYNVIVHKSMLDDSLTRAESRRTLVLDSQFSEILLSFVFVHMCVCVKMDVHVQRKQQLSLEADSGIVTQPTFPRVTILSSKDSQDIKSDIYWGTCAG